MVSENDVWRAASLAVLQHGADAPTVAAQRIDALLKEGDVVGHHTWKLILSAINELLRTERQKTESLN